MCLITSTMPSLTFKRDVADEAVADNHVGMPGVQVAAFDVADEVQDGIAFSSGVAALVSSLPLCSSSPMESRPTRGLRGVEDDARIDLAHDRELRQHLGIAIDVGADVDDHHRGAFEGREDRRQRGAVDAGHDALHHLGGGHDGAGVAGRNEAVRDAFAHQARRDTDGRVLFGADSLRGAVLHRDLLAGVMDVECGSGPSLSCCSSSARTTSSRPTRMTRTL